jgi:hypothetical protein
MDYTTDEVVRQEFSNANSSMRKTQPARKTKVTVGQLDGKVVFISGIARGQGRSHAPTLAPEGADIIGFDLCSKPMSIPYPGSTPEDLAETRNLIEETGRMSWKRLAGGPESTLASSV